MSVYVDPLIATRPYRKSENERWNWRQSCHMTADTEEELHVMANRLGLKRAWFQNHHPNPLLWHYDLTANKRKQALRLGAVERTHQQFAEQFIQSKGKPMEETTVNQSFTDEDALAQLPERCHDYYYTFRNDGYSPRRALKAILREHHYTHMANAKQGLPDYDEDIK